MMKRAGMVFAFVTLAAAFTAAYAQDKVVKLAPDQTFQFKANAYGCMSRDKLDAADQHAIAGEQGKIKAGGKAVGDRCPPNVGNESLPGLSIWSGLARLLAGG